MPRERSCLRLAYSLTSESKRAVLGTSKKGKGKRKSKRRTSRREEKHPSWKEDRAAPVSGGMSVPLPRASLLGWSSGGKVGTVALGSDANRPRSSEMDRVVLEGPLSASRDAFPAVS